jgi:ribosomal protein S18 acetylase RimI-like enzyme
MDKQAENTASTHAPLGEAALDDVVWNTLNGPHAALATIHGNARRFVPEVAPFGAVRPPEPGSAADLAALMGGIGSVALVIAPQVRPFGGVEPGMRVAIDQMVLADASALDSVRPVAMQALSASDVPDMLALVQATQPGPFGRRTIELGGYIGLRIDGRLVAMGGQRLKVPGFTEVSAICVAPECRGRGYAAAIIRALATAIRERGETPFLHVVATNTSAIELYGRLGFSFRRRLDFCVYTASS